MENYYDEILEEIRKRIDEKEYNQAMQLIQKELSMPYIPAEVEPELRNLQNQVKFFLNDAKKTSQQSIDDLLEGLRGNARQQLASCASISKYNLRDYVPEIQSYLSQDPYPEAAALLVEEIAEQEIQEEFVWNKDGVEYQFYGDSLTPCALSKGFLKACEYLQKWFDKNLDLYEMSKTLLVHEVFMFLPLSYEEEEGEMLAYDIFEQICHMMGRDDLLQTVHKKSENAYFS